jgi:soluble cytochrome b562
VAYFERYAEINGDSLRLSVPGDKIDDFLKSLTVIDATSGKPAPVAYPTHGSAFVGNQQLQQQQSQVQNAMNGMVSMEIQLQGPKPHKLFLSYVTDAPSWKPSYRISLGKDGKMKLEGWAIVDNTSGEDWNKVKLGVGSSSAMSFRFDLRSIRMVQRETLQSNDLFAQAPPMGGSSFSGQPMPAGGKRVVAELDDSRLAAASVRDEEERPEAMFDKSVSTVSKPKVPQASTGSVMGGFGGGRAAAAQAPMRESKPMPPPPPRNKDDSGLERLATQYKNSRKQVVVEGWADSRDGDKYGASLERANRAREKLIRSGLDPSQVVAVGNGMQAGRAGGVSIIEAPDMPQLQQQAVQVKAPDAEGNDPIGKSYFESQTSMTVPKETSAMVSILSADTEGGFVYLYDPEGARGNATYPFRTVRLKNPTNSVLESGPVAVFGEDGFIGEGMSEPIPAKSYAFVPFALDRQIVVERKDDQRDAIARILTVQRGVFSTEVKHTKKKTLTLTNRMQDKATVYIKHAVTAGYKLTKAPTSQERMGESYLFKIDVPAGAKVDVDIEEETPVFKSTDIRSNVGMEMIRAYLSTAALTGKLKESVTKLLELQKEMANLDQRIATSREQMNEYRNRMDELHAQIVTLKVVKSGGPLMQSLEKKMQEVSDRLSKATIDLVALQEKQMLARISFQDGVAELSFETEGQSNPSATH